MRVSGSDGAPGPPPSIVLGIGALNVTLNRHRPSSAPCRWCRLRQKEVDGPAHRLGSVAPRTGGFPRAIVATAPLKPSSDLTYRHIGERRNTPMVARFHLEGHRRNHGAHDRADLDVHASHR